MQDTAQVALLHQHRQRAMYCRLYLTHVFTQFRFDILHAQRRVNIGLSLTWNRLKVRLFPLKKSIIVNGHVHTERAPS